jgi:cysteinyl-tRNA synthetase
MLQVEGKKMSKSLGNFFTVRDLLDQGIPGEVIRYVFLITHYRSPMDWTAEKARQAKTTLQLWHKLTYGAPPGKPSDAMVAALADDLNTSAAISELHRLAELGSASELLASAQLVGLLDPLIADWVEGFLEILGIVEGRSSAFRAARQWTARLDEARRSKDFAEADRIRAMLQGSGMKVSSSPSGTVAEPTADFDPAKLEALQ